MRAVFLLGRAIFGGFFVQNGLHHFQDRQTMSAYAASKGVPNPDVAVVASGALMLAGGLSVLSGWKPRQGLGAIVGFLVPVSLMMHRFWEVEDQQQRMPETVNFMKNMALAGAALMLMQLPGPWPASLDELSAEQDMYLRLDTRERLRLMA
jgi:uncharacterized membrane protein YphA (DoxX/SURF4 family)